MYYKKLSMLEETLSCKSKKQSVASRSSAESEYWAIANIIIDFVWRRQLLDEFGYTSPSSMQLYCIMQSLNIMAIANIILELVRK